MLTVENLAFGYNERLLFENLSFTLREGQILQVKGPNGIGKSSLLAILAGILSPKDGQIILKRSNDQLVMDRRYLTEYLAAESNNLFLKMSAIENLSFWVGLKHSIISKADILSELDYWQLADPLISQQLAVEKFSTGMKRRLALARLTLSASLLWLLDEPLFGLDQVAVSLFCARLSRHLKAGGMAIFVSHEQLALDSFVESKCLILNLEWNRSVK